MSFTDTRSESEGSPFSWVFVGPLFALTSSLLLYVKAPHDFQPVLVAALAGLFFTSIWRLNGLYFSLFLLALYAVPPVVHASVPLYWTLGALMTVALSFILTHFTLEEARKEVLGWKKAIKSKLDNVKAESEKVSLLELKLKEIDNEYSCLERIQELSRIELLQSFAEKETIKEELSRVYLAKRKLEEEYEDQKERLSGHIEGRRMLDEMLQTESALISEMKEQMEALVREKELLKSTVERLQAEPEVIEGPEGRDAEYRRLFGLYQQLKEQFQEKNQLLDEARRELFLAREQGAFFEKSLVELEAQSSPEFKELSQELGSLTVKLDEAHQEIAKLESVVSKIVDSG